MTTPDFQVLEKESAFPQVNWACDYTLNFLEENIRRFESENGLDLEPDFQRGHVWTDGQRVSFVEYFLSGGPTTPICFACHGWHSGDIKSPMVIVDGKQRLESLRRFVRDELPVRGGVMSKWTGRLRFHHSLRFQVADIDRPTTLRWYLALNAGGTPHTKKEIEHVRQLLAKETGG